MRVVPVSERSLSEELSAVRLSPSPAVYVSSRLGLPRVPFTASVFIPPTPPPSPLRSPGRITPFCFSNSAMEKRDQELPTTTIMDNFWNFSLQRGKEPHAFDMSCEKQKVTLKDFLHSTRYFSISWTSAMLSRRSLVKRVRSCWLGALNTIRTLRSLPGIADVSLIPWA